MQTDNHQWNVILAWVLATTAGLVLGGLSILTLVTGLALGGTSPLLVGLIGGAGLGGGIGIAQWLVLRRHLRTAVWWIPASMVGGMIGVALGLVLSDALQPLLPGFLGEGIESRPAGQRVLWNSAVAGGAAGAVFGAVLGAAQWLVLRPHVRPAVWWILVSGLGWTAGLFISAAMVDVVGLVLSLLLAGIVAGAATGSLLPYLFAGGAASSSRATAS